MMKKITEFRLYCPKCNREFDFDPYLYKCPRCKIPLNIKWNMEMRDFAVDKESKGIFKFKKFFPPGLQTTSLGEGDTHIIDFNRKNLFFKLEYLNPSGSFKDRGSALAIAAVKRIGLKEVNEDSSGNAGSSIALYSAAFGIKANIYMPVDAPENKKNLVKIFGGYLNLEKDREKAHLKAVEDSIKKKIYYIGHVLNPFFIQGLKSISYEIYLKKLFPTDIFIPVGSGGLYLGIYYGYKDLIEIGLIDNLPRLHTVEASGYERVSKEIYGKEIYPGTRTILADGVRVSGPPRLYEVLSVLKESDGISVVVSDDEIRNSTKSLIRKGLFVEPTSATVYAAYKKVLEEKLVDKDGKILLPLTGSGFKAIDKIYKYIL